MRTQLQLMWRFFQEGQLGNDEYVNVIIKDVLMMLRTNGGNIKSIIKHKQHNHEIEQDE